MTVLEFNKLGQFFSQKALRSLSAGVAAGTVMCAVGAVAQPANAVVIGGISLSDNGFVNEVIDYSNLGDFDTSGEILQNVLIDKDVNTYAVAVNPGAYVTLGFENPVMNAGGFDLALFDLDESLAIFDVIINGITRTYNTEFTGYYADGVDPFQINAVQINLDDFGILANDFITQLTINFDTAEPPSLALVGTIQRSVPEPSAMFGILATAGFLACQRKLKLAKKA